MAGKIIFVKATYKYGPLPISGVHIQYYKYTMDNDGETQEEVTTFRLHQDVSEW